MDYSRLTALLIEATKAQQALIRRQQQQIRVQQTQIATQRVQIQELQDNGALQAHSLGNVAAQVKLLQGQFAQLETSISAGKVAANSSAALTSVARR